MRFTKYVNAFKTRSQTSVNKHILTCEMSFIVFLLQMIWPTVFFEGKKSDHDVKLNWSCQ